MTCILIDDFTTGPKPARPLTSAVDSSYQRITTNPDFPVRHPWFWISSPESAQPGTLDISSAGRLTVGTGPHVYHRLDVVYGFGEDGTVGPLHLDLSKFNGFRLNFDFNDLPLQCQMLIWSDSGATYSHNNATDTPASFTPFSIEFPFTGTPARRGFVGAARQSDIDIILFLTQPASLGGANDFKIRSFEIY